MESLRLRGRLADKIAREHGFEGGYKLVSLVEMDFAKDEQQYLEGVLFAKKHKRA